MILQAIENYPKGSYFYSATNNVKTALKVTNLKYSESKDIENKLGKLNKKVVHLWNETFPHKKDKVDLNNQLIQSLAKKQLKEIKQLNQIEKDIIEETGGLIYCGETKIWAKKFAS